MNEPFMNDESLSKEFTTKYLFFWVHAQFEEFNNNPKGAFNYFKKTVNLWLDNPQYIDMNPRMYIGTCSTFFKYLIHQDDLLAEDILDINYQNLFSKLKGSSLSSEEKTKYRQLFIIAEILSLKKQNKHADIVLLTDKVLNKENFTNTFPPYQKVIIKYYTALAYFNTKDYLRAIDILHPMVNNLKKQLFTNLTFSAQTVCLFLSALLETKQFEYLKRIIPKLKKALLQMGLVGPFEKEYLKMIPQIISVSYEDNKTEVYQRFLTKTNNIQDSPGHFKNSEHLFFYQHILKKNN